MKTCFQRRLLDVCKCLDYRIPADSSIEAYEGIPDENFKNVCSNDTLRAEDTDHGKFCHFIFLITIVYDRISDMSDR